MLLLAVVSMIAILMRTFAKRGHRKDSREHALIVTVHEPEKLNQLDSEQNHA